MASTPTKNPIEKLTDSMKGLVIGASGKIPGYRHGMYLLGVSKADKDQAGSKA
jgi:hypothetical protein